jgi:UDPglucose 6-dehydrogenase
MIGVIGQGFVGGSLTTVFSERGEKVGVFDKAGKIANGGMNTFERLNADGAPETFQPSNIFEFVQSCELSRDFSGVFFVCVPTPMKQDGSADISIVQSVLEDIAVVPDNWESPNRIAVVKSTIPPGTTEKWNQDFESRGFSLRVVFNPEFLTEANAVQDMRNQNRIILGGPRPYINTVKQIFQKAFPQVPIVKTSSTTAEMVKYATNCFLAVKVSFANELAQICEALDEKGLNIDYDKVVEYAKLDKRLGDSHWSVPGPVPTHDGRFVRGFGGHCVIRDTVVSTPNGNCLVQNVIPGDVVTSATYNINDVDLKIVNEVSSREYNGEIITFHLIVEGITKQISCTPSHLFPILREGKQELCQAKDILETDELFFMMESKDL